MKKFEEGNVKTSNTVCSQQTLILKVCQVDFLKVISLINLLRDKRVVGSPQTRLYLQILSASPCHEGRNKKSTEFELVFIGRSLFNRDFASLSLLKREWEREGEREGQIGRERETDNFWM
jgi:hypothetical protein